MLKNIDKPYAEGKKLHFYLEFIPQVLMKDGKPVYLYAPSGTNIQGDSNTMVYVFKFEE